MSGAVNMMLGGTLAFSATTSPDSFVASAIAPGVAQTVSAAGVSVQGGTPPYTYLWTYVSGDSEIYAKNPTLPNTRFAAYSSTPDAFTAVWKCTVTDNEANTTDTNTVTISIELF